MRIASTTEWLPPRPSDGGGFFNSAPTVSLTATNVTPQVATAVTVTAAVSDPEGDPTSTVWSLTSKPAGSAAALSGSGTQRTITPDLYSGGGVYVIHCEATDDGGALRGNSPGSPLTSSADITITAQAPPDVAAAGLAGAKEAVASLWGNGGASTYIADFEADVGRTVRYFKYNLGDAPSRVSLGTLTVSSGKLPGTSVSNGDTVLVTAATASGAAANSAYWVVEAGTGDSKFGLALYQGGVRINLGAGTVTLSRHVHFGDHRAAFDSVVTKLEALGRGDVELVLECHMWTSDRTGSNTQGQSPPLAYRRTRRAQWLAGLIESEWSATLDHAHRSITGITGSTATSRFTKTSHGLTTGLKVRFTAKTGGSSLDTSTTYRAKKIDANTFELYAESQWVHGALTGSALALGSTVTAATLFARRINFRLAFSHEGDLPGRSGGYCDGRIVYAAGDLTNTSDAAISTITGTASTNRLTKTSHGFVNGLKVKVTAIGSGASGLTVGSTYYVCNLGVGSSNNNFQLTTTRADAFVAVPTPVSVGSDSTTITITPQDEAECSAQLDYFYDICHAYTIPVECDYNGDGAMFVAINQKIGAGTDTRLCWEYGKPTVGKADGISQDIYPGVPRGKSTAASLTMLNQLIDLSVAYNVPWGIVEHGLWAVDTKITTASVTPVAPATTTDTITAAAAHTFSVNDRIVFGVASGGSKPSAISILVTYYVHTVVSATQLKIKSTLGGSAMTLGASSTNGLILHKRTAVTDGTQWSINTSVSVTSSTFAKTAHGFIAGQCVVVEDNGSSTNLPEWTPLYVTTAGLTANAFKLSLTPGSAGTPISCSNSTGGDITIVDGREDGTTWHRLVFDRIAALRASGAGMGRYICTWTSGQYSLDGTGGTYVKYFLPTTWANIYASPTGLVSGAIT